jgi:hypothetical protein
MNRSTSGNEISSKLVVKVTRLRKWLLKSVAVPGFIALCGGLTPAFAAGYSAMNATITEVLASPAAFYIYVSVAPTGGTESCATQTVSSYRFVISPATSGANVVIATALAAHASGQAIDIYGTGACDVWPDTETINFIIAH